MFFRGLQWNKGTKKPPYQRKTEVRRTKYFLVQFPIQDVKHAGFELDLSLLFFSDADRNGLVCVGVELCFHFAIFPGNVHGDISSGFETSHLTLAPSRGQCRENINHSGMALKQGLCHSGRITEVSVDLIGRIPCRGLSHL